MHDMWRRSKNGSSFERMAIKLVDSSPAYWAVIAGSSDILQI